MPGTGPESMYSVKRTILLRDSDAAGVLFFARYLALAHDAYEAFMMERGIRFGHQVRKGRFIMPIVHAESDHRRPLWVGDCFTIQLYVAMVKRRAFTIHYEFRLETGELAATCKTTHVAVDKSSGRAIPLPREVLDVLQTETLPPGKCLDEETQS